MTQILRYYFTTVKPQYCSKPRFVWFHWKNKIYVEIRKENGGPEWSFENSKNTTVLDKPWYLKLCLACTNQTPFKFQYYSIIKYHTIVLKLQIYYSSKQGLIVSFSVLMSSSLNSNSPSLQLFKVCSYGLFISLLDYISWIIVEK
jgi:hypothetical protein